MRLNLLRNCFSEKERELVTYGTLQVTAFRYSTGVEALKIQNSKGYFVILPFQGQQVWRAHFLDRDLTMKGTIDEPNPTTEYLKTYGGFLYHCGVTSFGVPQQDDTHPLHGETPNIPYQNAHLECGEDENGKYISVGGLLDYNIAFTRHYQFQPECRLYENASTLKIDVTIENLRTEPMEYMYLCHINFRPINGAELIYSAKKDGEHIKVHKRVADNVPPEQAKHLMDFMNQIQENPAVHDHIGAPGEIYDPEICFAIRYQGDENKRAYTLQYEKGVGACYVSHPVDSLPLGVRWISRTGSEDAMGMILPATAEHLGYSNAKRTGMVKTLKKGEPLHFSIEAGYVDNAQAQKVIKKIEGILGE